MRHIRSHQCCSTETRAVVKSTPGATSFYGRPLGEAVGPPWVPARSRSWSPLKQKLANVEARSKKQTVTTAAERRRDRRRLPPPWLWHSLSCHPPWSAPQTINRTLADRFEHCVACVVRRCARTFSNRGLQDNSIVSWHFMMNTICKSILVQSFWIFSINCCKLLVIICILNCYCLIVYASLFIIACTLFLSYHSYVYALSFIIACTFLLSCHVIFIVYATLPFLCALNI